VPKLTDTQKSLIILGGGGLLAVGAGVMVYFDLGEKAKVEEEIEGRKKARAENAAEIAKVPDLKNKLVAYKKVVTDNARILPTLDDINNFIRDLSTLEKEVGISIRSLPSYNPSAYRNVSAVTRIPMKMQIIASSRSFLRFLNLLENRDRLVSVTTFRVNPSGNSPKPGQEIEHDISVEFELYRYDPKAGGAEPPIKPVEEAQLLETKEVRDLVASKAKPTSIEKYQLLPGRDNRRDPFVDPRRRVVQEKGAGTEGGTDKQEETLFETLSVQLEKLRLEIESYRNADQAKDFLRMAASKRNAMKYREELEDNIRRVSQSSPEFKRRDLQEKYINEIKQPYLKLVTDSSDIFEGTGGPKGQFRFTEVIGQGLRKELKEMMDKRQFPEAAEKWAVIDQLARDAKQNVDDGARPILKEMEKMGEHARYQTMLGQKKIDIQGIVRMERVSAVIINGRTLFPGKNLDRDTIFLRVEDGGARGEGDRLIFSIMGHEVDYIQPKPQLLNMGKAELQQE
jgi:Tfp pilus assembly protein PilO